MGRSGSIAIAHLYANNKNINYYQAVDMIRYGFNGYQGKHDIYPHINLDSTLEKLYGGENRPKKTKIIKIKLN